MKDIYGCVSSCNNSCDIGALLPLFKLQLNTIFVDTVHRFKIVVDTLITAKVKAVSFLGEMGGTSTANAVIVVYMRWVKMNPGVEFSLENKYHTNQVKDIYLSYGIDWRSDPLIGNLDQSAQQPACRAVVNAANREILSTTL